MKNIETQIVVIAAGPSGLAAAVQAAEDGAKVVVLEKAATVGGAANMGMGPLGIGTKHQKRQMIDISVEKAFNMFMEYTHYMVDARLVKRYFEQSAETIEWLEDMGVEFEGAFRYFPKSEATWHIVKTDQEIGPRAASFMNKALYARALELGVTFFMETPVKKILMEDGKVVGVLATDKDGEELQVSCQAAIVCTGGAGANKELIKQETGFTQGVDMFNFAIPGLMGEGMKMAWEAGAGKTPVRIEMAANIEGCDELPQGVSNVFSQPNLLVNKFGKRVMNEDQMQNATYLSNVVMHQKDRVCFSIVDTSIVKNYVRNGVDNVSLVRTNPDVSDFFEGIKIAKENGSNDFIVADSIEELAEMAGIDAESLQDTVDQYNDYCDSVDEEFFKDKKYLRPVVKAPFYCAKVRGGGYGTVGGVKINENCEAIDEDFEPVPGLYCAGTDSCNIYDDSYMFLLPGNSMGYAVNTGRIAGMSAAEYVEE
ncbi:FAD-dependent oxidoreductase [Anaerobium acetethylicum]|uniref:Fumarate reductase flavoprotein subunit n=1 Tax=Anaerobium acetethylicum TaxID=1619234 RepID=A0A1D3TW96_9FIRM|nr:FAD-dependent oxidoreductase [Anaerobium acetethylicum]SCP98467.1 fumarate reductase flavoprotein subunit [Anaerobium acetethylicum]